MIHREGAGCYGHNGADDVALDAALVARATNGRPVKLQWMREDEFAWEPYGSAMAMQLARRARRERQRRRLAARAVEPHAQHAARRSATAATCSPRWHLEKPLDAGPGRNIPQPSGGSDRNACRSTSSRSSKTINHLLPDMPLRVSALRTLGAYANVFALESFMDELARRGGRRPGRVPAAPPADPRAKAVIEAVAARAGWKPGEKGDGRRGRGIGFAKYKNLAVYCAVIADVDVDPATRRGARAEALWRRPTPA